MDAIFLISSLANFSAAYNLAITGHILLLLELAGSPATELQSSLVAAAAFVGAIVGQIGFGLLAGSFSIQFGLALTLFLCTVSTCLACSIAGVFLNHCVS